VNCLLLLMPAACAMRERRCAIHDSIAKSRGGAMAETRKIAAILVADVVGYSRLAGADEEGRSRGSGRCAAI
jgi:class 3 adenylate cyclase